MKQMIRSMRLIGCSNCKLYVGVRKTLPLQGWNLLYTLHVVARLATVWAMALCVSALWTGNADLMHAQFVLVRLQVRA